MDADAISSTLPPELLRVVGADYIGLLNKMARRIQLAWGRYKGWQCRDCWRVFSSVRHLKWAAHCDALMYGDNVLKLVCREPCCFYCPCGGFVLDDCPLFVREEPSITGYMHFPQLYIKHSQHASRTVPCPEGCGQDIYIHRYFAFIVWAIHRQVAQR
mgnify:CR=1 FL=1